MDSFQQLKLDEMFFDADQLIAEKKFAEPLFECSSFESNHLHNKVKL